MRLPKSIAYLLVLPIITSIGYCATPNEIREYANIDTIDSTYSSEERAEIKKEYAKVVEHNRLAQMMIDSNFDRSVIDKEIEGEVKELQSKLEKAVSDLEDAFGHAKSVKEVKEASVKVGNIESKIEKVRGKGEDIPTELMENKWVDAYNEVIKIEDILSKEKDIGVVGKKLRYPLEVKMELMNVFGEAARGDGTKSYDNYVMLKGLKSNNVLNLWHGTVKSINKIGELYEVVVEHSSYMHTRYTNIRDVKVKVGDYINQYTYLGKLGKVEDSEIPYLKLEVLFDNAQVNPMLFFGVNGINAVKEYSSKYGVKVDMDAYLNIKESKDTNGKDATKKPIYNKTGEVEDGAIVPKLEGEAPSPSPTIDLKDLHEKYKTTDNKSNR